ncbi:hypothetical protein J1N35_007210 [Gossypium stocksii]|uniref:Uncharacterized protein n=1 Tax=Gossypium stocksii TaxID=47602 RepID=A0A9D4AD95_9ROSI|nr:hypothetical protein J1N35_007210 [Gossypium stocksii]
MKETREKEREPEKEMSGKDESEQEKAMNVFTNQPTSCPHIVSSFQVSKDSIDVFQLYYLPDKRRFQLIKKGKIIDYLSPLALKDGKTSFSNETYRVDRCDGEVSINQYKQVMNLCVKKWPYKTPSSIVCDDGGKSRWNPPKEGGYANDMFSFRVICDFQAIGSNIVNFINRGCCDGDKFFMSKWLDLRTNCFQEEGYNANLVASCYDLT